MRRSSLLLSSLLLGLLVVVHPTFSGGPLGGNGTTPRRYPAGALPLTYKTDLGALGAFTNPTAVQIAIYAFAQWDNVQSAALSFVNGGSLPRDVSLSTDPLISGSGQFSDGVNPIVFDNNGSITDDRIGLGASNDIAGFAASAWAGNQYTEGYAIINGVLTGTGTQTDQDQYKATMTHEIGHMLGVHHSQVTLHSEYCTMYPVVQGGSQATLKPDDTAAIANLYPTPAFTAATGSISGTVRRPNGANLGGINVLAVDSVTGATYSTIVDYYAGNDIRFDNTPAPTGAYTISGLPPGRYFVRIETIRPEFTGGSSIASYDPPINTNVRHEWYNGGFESGDMLADNSNAKAGVVVSAGATTANIHLIANESATLSEFAYDNGTTVGYITIPDGSGSGTITRLAVRGTAPTLGSLVGIRFFLGDQSDLRLGGRLTVSVHTNIPGSLAGIPGAELGSVTIPYSDLAANHDNEIYLRGIGQSINLPQGAEFHVVLQTNGIGLPRLYMDNGQPSQTRTSYYNGVNGWRNMGQGLITIPHNLRIAFIYSNRIVGDPAPVLTTVPSQVTFGEARPGGSVTRSLSVRNTGTAPLNVSSLSIIGTHASLFSITGGGGSFTIQPGDSHAVTLKFSPTDASGAKSANLSIVSNDPGSPSQIPLTGLANQPIATALVDDIDLGETGTGSTKTLDTMALRNTGTDTLRIFGGTLVGPDGGGAIRILSGNGSRILLPNAALTIRLRFAPTEIRGYSATLRIAHDAGDTIVIPITARGVGANAVAPAEVVIEPVTVGLCRDTTVFLRNDGNGGLTVTTMTISGAEASDFTIVGPPLPQMIAPGDSLGIMIRFCPTATGRRNALLAINHDATGSPTTITLIGNPGAGGVDRDRIVTGGLGLSLLPIIPNPTRDRAVITWRAIGRGRVDADLSIIDLQGTPVMTLGQQRIESNGGEQRSSTTVDLNELPAGVYMVVLRVGERMAVARVEKR